MASQTTRPARAAQNPSNNVSYETFAPRSSGQLSRLSRLAELTAGPTARASSAASAATTGGSSARDTVLKAMSPPPIDYEESKEDVFESDAAVRRALTMVNARSDQLSNFIKHTTSLRLALRASINIADDVSNRHAELIRHSGELSAAADRLQEEQAVLSRHAEEIGLPLKHYDSVDTVGLSVGVLFKGRSTVQGLAKVKVDDDEFPMILDKIDDAVEFFGRETGGKQALEAEMKRVGSAKNSSTSQISGNFEYFRRALALQEAALFLIREAVVDRIKTTTSQVSAALNLPKATVAADKLEASLIYTRFHGISNRSNRLLLLLRKRLHRGDAYHDLIQLCRNTYCSSRESLLASSVQAHLDKLNDQHGLVGMTRLASVFLSRICTVESSLYVDFFGEKKAEVKGEETEDTEKKAKASGLAGDSSYLDAEFQAYLGGMCSSLHRTIRRGLVKVLDLDTLCQIVSVLREERSMASSSPTTTAAARAISSVIEDSQERLIFCATNSLTKEVTRFKASPADLNYPDKLRKNEEVSEATSEEDAVEKQMQVYESWFPPLRSVLRILSKIFRVVEPRVFEDIALQSVRACSQRLKDGASYIQTKKGVMHADLFLVKHLLILREQLSPFDIDLRAVERQLDFSDAGKAVSRFFANRNRRLFSISTENALVTLLREGVSIQEESVDSKRDLEDGLRAACNAFIEHTCKSLTGGIVDFLEQCRKSDPTKLNSQRFMNVEKVKTILTQVLDRLEVEAGETTTQMSLYLDNPATQSILLKPVSRKVCKTLEEVRKIINETEDDTNGWDDDTRAQCLAQIDEIEKVVKATVKV